MDDKVSLLEAYNKADYPIGGNGKRNVQVLKEVIENTDGNTDSDMYGKGKVIEDFQTKMARYLGKESAVFFPSGTMAQQIALRIWCDEKQLKKVAYHPLCHLEIHEEKGLRELHRIESVLLANEERMISLEDVLNMTEEVACVLLELPQREIGGQLPPFEVLEAISAHCRGSGIKLHLDGARLFEILPYYGKSASDICALFDSVYVSFYKGVGGIAGAILAGDEAFTSQSKVWKRRHGGDLISLYPYILSSDYYFEQRLPKMERYYREAIELAERFNACHAIATKPLTPVCNMFHVHANVSKDRLEKALISVYAESGIGLTAFLRETGETTCMFEVNMGDRYANVPKDKLSNAFRLLDEKMQSTE
ncbi:threonine aldolase family protein [Cohnella herbarum]|uniref:Low specificity L-threonine aldolase n=1 Tax=Cohnella herbarum TaxID=2728023 RepID=A0A7Z2VQQ4_9BACL|nr:beta-eliminating lyase-related protein [Cohnella herbarum]QJD87731.1 low specificity L-threonine aldolase [Cohnella herbarum]